MRFSDITLCVTGHRPSSLPWGYDESDPRLEDLRGRMAERILRCAGDGAERFITGMAQGVDTWFAELVLELLPGAVLVAAVPFEGQERLWPQSEQERYHALLARCRRVEVLAPRYHPHALLFRNQWMVDRASRVMAVWDGTPGGTAHTVRYAESLGRVIYQLPSTVSPTAGNFQ